MRRQQRLRQLDRQLDIMQRRYTRALLRFMRAIGRRVTHLDGATTVIDDARADIRGLVRVWCKRAMDLFGPENIRYLLERVGRKSVELKSAFDLFQDIAEEWLREYALEQATRIATGMLERARKSLIDSRNKGLGERVAVRALQKAIGGKMSDAQRIARTEMHTAANKGSEAAASSTGLDMVKEWGATDDKRTRETHVEADGQRREMAEPFDVGQAKLRYPGDENGPPEEIINCRCVALYHPRINGEVFD